MNVSVCIIYRNSENTLPELIRSFDYLPLASHQFEFIFVDNNSTDRSNEVIAASKLNNFKILKRDNNHLAEARNQAIQNSQYDYIYFIDSDCSLNSDTWTELLKNWNPNEFHGWGGSQKFPTSISFLRLLDLMRSHYLGHFGSAQMMVGTKLKIVEHLSTTHVLFSKKMLLELKGFDSRLATSAEDLELSLRIQKSGYRLQFIPSSYVNHFICTDLLGWLKKAWRNGLWQTRLIAINPSILKTRRFWPSLLILTVALLSPQIILILALIYFIYLSFLVSFHRERLSLLILFASTHFTYFISGLVGLSLATFDFMRSVMLPKTTKH